jgi:CRP-like cAMP-binding protein
MNKQTIAMCHLFEQLSGEQLDALSTIAEEAWYDAGYMVYRQGTRADYMYIVLEGSVELSLQRKNGLGIYIDSLGEDDLFGSCLCLDFGEYSLSARCTRETRMLKISTRELKRLMDADPPLGYLIQRAISRAYFQRYLDTVIKLQNIVGAIVLKAG